MIEIKNKLIVDTIEELLDPENLVTTFSTDENGKKYSNNIVAFDTESCQVDVSDKEHYATTVTYQLAVNDRCILVRTPEDFLDICVALSTKIHEIEGDAHKTRRKKPAKVIVYVHNLQYDAYFTVWDVIKTMNVEDAFIVKGKFNKFTFMNLEFRCSLMLTNLSLATAIKEYVPKAIRLDKLKGAWDYKDIRSPLTVLKELEVKYACIDVFGLVDVIRELCKLHGIEVGQLPTTSTSFTKKACENYCLGNKRKFGRGRYSNSYSNLIKTLNLDLDQLVFAKSCFRGGISDTNIAIADQLQFDIGDFDISSEYPSAIERGLFPMSSPRWINTTFEMLKKWAFFPYQHRVGFCTRVRFHKLKVRKGVLIPLITVHKTFEDDILTDNDESRIFEAECITLNLNSIDFKIVCEQYEFESAEVIQTMIYKMDLLPKPIREFILEGYKNKTQYKGVIGKELQYKLAKIYINAIYGVMATYPLNEDWIIQGDELVDLNAELKHKNDEESLRILIDKQKKELDKYNKKDNRFSYYLWGVYVAAYGHQYLWEGMKIVGSDIIACDTDSVKFRNGSKYKEQFAELNKKIESELDVIAQISDIDRSWYSPADKKGKVHTLGTWDNDSDGIIFMVSKRSKCYMKCFKWNDKAEESGEIKIIHPKYGEVYYHLTCAGVQAIKYDDEDHTIMKGALAYFMELVNQGKYETIEDVFVDNVDIPAEWTGKMTHVYSRNQQPFTYKDRDGNEYTMTNTHAIYLMDAPFSFSGKFDKLSEDKFFPDEWTKRMYYMGFFNVSSVVG